MLSICGSDCCLKCEKSEECGGCQKTNGHPFCGNCIAAETIKKSGFEEFLKLKQDLIKEVNSLNIDGIHIDELNLLNGFYINLEYEMPNGEKIKLLKDNNVYFGNQIQIQNTDYCYGVIADKEYIIVCKYGENGENPELILYKKLVL